MKWILVFFAWPAFGWTLLGANTLGWNTRVLTIYVSLTDCTVEEAKLLAVIDSAIQSWNGIPTAEITLQRALVSTPITPNQFVTKQATEVPLILCDPQFESHASADPDFVPAVTLTSFDSSRLNYGGILLNSQVGSSAEINQLFDGELSITIAHELGHVLGLGHTDDRLSLMYYSISGKSHAALSEDDMEGISFLYPRNELQRGGFGVSCNATHVPGASPWQALWWLGGILLVAMIRIARLL